MDKLIKIFRGREKGRDRDTDNPHGIFDTAQNSSSPPLTFGTDYTKKRASHDSVLKLPSNPSSPCPNRRLLPSPGTQQQPQEHTLTTPSNTTTATVAMQRSPRPDHRVFKGIQAVPGGIGHPWAFPKTEDQRKHSGTSSSFDRCGSQVNHQSPKSISVDADIGIIPPATVSLIEEAEKQQNSSLHQQPIPGPETNYGGLRRVRDTTSMPSRCITDTLNPDAISSPYQRSSSTHSAQETPPQAASLSCLTTPIAARKKSGEESSDSEHQRRVFTAKVAMSLSAKSFNQDPSISVGSGKFSQTITVPSCKTTPFPSNKPDVHTRTRPLGFREAFARSRTLPTSTLSPDHIPEIFAVSTLQEESSEKRQLTRNPMLKANSVQDQEPRQSSVRPNQTENTQYQTKTLPRKISPASKPTTPVNRPFYAPMLLPQTTAEKDKKALMARRQTRLQRQMAGFTITEDQQTQPSNDKTAILLKPREDHKHVGVPSPTTLPTNDPQRLQQQGFPNNTTVPTNDPQRLQQQGFPNNTTVPTNDPQRVHQQGFPNNTTVPTNDPQRLQQQGFPNNTTVPTNDPQRVHQQGFPNNTTVTQKDHQHNHLQPNTPTTPLLPRQRTAMEVSTSPVPATVVPSNNNNSHIVSVSSRRFTPRERSKTQPISLDDVRSAVAQIVIQQPSTKESSPRRVTAAPSRRAQMWLQQQQEQQQKTQEPLSKTKEPSPVRKRSILSEQEARSRDLLKNRSPQQEIERADRYLHGGVRFNRPESSPPPPTLENQRIHKWMGGTAMNSGVNQNLPKQQKFKEEQNPDELSRLSLTEKKKLFSPKKLSAPDFSALKQRHMTQPISFDDIARANLLVLQQAADKSGVCAHRYRIDSASSGTGFTNDSRRTSLRDLYSVNNDQLSSTGSDSQLGEMLRDLRTEPRYQFQTTTMSSDSQPSCSTSRSQTPNDYLAGGAESSSSIESSAEGLYRRIQQSQGFYADDESTASDERAPPRHQHQHQHQQPRVNVRQMAQEMLMSGEERRGRGYRQELKPAPRVQLRKEFVPLRKDSFELDAKFSKQLEERHRELVSERNLEKTITVAQRARLLESSSSSSSTSDYRLRSKTHYPNMASSAEQPSYQRNESGRPRATTTTSIQNRISQMKDQGENNWRVRSQQQSKREASPMDGTVLLRDHATRTSAGIPGRSASLLERRQLLETSQEGWKSRVNDKDTDQFTVQGRMNQAGVEMSNKSPVVMRRAPVTPSNDPNRREGTPTSADSESIKLRKNCESRTPTMRKISKDTVKVVTVADLDQLTISDNNVSKEKAKQPDEASPITVAVPTITDKEIDGFFRSPAGEDFSTLEKVDVETDDFDELFLRTNDMLPSLRPTVRPKRNTASKVRNPMKHLALRTDIKSEYVQVSSGVVDKEMRRIKRNGVSSTVELADAALAGLASTENIHDAKDTLRKLTENSASPLPLYELDALPYKPIMLLHIKGRRHVQVRLVAPELSSVNAGDCYLLVSKSQVFVWQGLFANVIEQSKARDLGQWIVAHKGLGYRGSTSAEPVYLQGACSDVQSPSMRRFWEVLGAGAEPGPAVAGAGPPNEDETYEISINETNCVYRVVNNELVPHKEAWGQPLTISILNSNESFVFDFGGEVYCWSGKFVVREDRKQHLELAKVLLQQGYDYSECDINPLSPLAKEENGGLPMQDSSRPTWVLFAKVCENMETILFKEKFIDWPDSTRLIGSKSSVGSPGSEKNPSRQALQLPSVEEMINSPPLTAHLILECRSVGRGGAWQERVDGILRRFEMTSHGVIVWHVAENEHCEMPIESLGQLHSQNTYVIRWEYSRTSVGKRIVSTLNDSSKNQCVYFFWQGRDSSVTEKGVAALITVELDDEKAPQIRVPEGRELAVLCRLFSGRMIIHQGSRNRPLESNYRLFIARGDRPEEASLYEVKVSIDSLRTRGCLLLVDRASGHGMLWLGRLANKEGCDTARSIVTSISESTPSELGLAPRVNLTVEELKEGGETSTFWSCFGADDSWTSAMSKEPRLHPLRLWHLTGVSGEQLEAVEIANPLQPDPEESWISPFPFLQSVLYQASQPALFLLDAGRTVYLWSGFWPLLTPTELSSPSSDGNTSFLNSSGGIPTDIGSAQVRFDGERVAALKLAKSYIKAKGSVVEKGLVVYAGCEPDSFKQLFHLWEDNLDAITANLSNGRMVGQEDPINDTLGRLTCDTFSYKELKARPLPEGVDPLRIESYLSDEEFVEHFNITKEEFYKSPPWKQTEMKKPLGFF